MTCIAGVVSNGKVYIGGDSAGVNADGHLQLRKDSKVFKNGEYLIGVSGSWKINQVLKYTKLEDSDNSIHDPHQFMVTHFLPQLWAMRMPEDKDFELLVGFRGRLFHIYGLSQVSEEIADYEACGSGAQVARGCLFGQWNVFQTPHSRIESALLAAERFCSGVRGPFNILSI
jgi:ATP-dependent protease HslVU (ClpYQ) peptidase subunit